MQIFLYLFTVSSILIVNEWKNLPSINRRRRNQPTNTSTQQREAIAAAEVYEGSAKTEQNKEDN